MASMLRSAARRLALGHVKRAILGTSEAKSTQSQIVLPPRPPSTPSRYLSIAAVFRNEARYLAEWLEFHRMMGVEHVYLYDHGSTDHPAPVLEPFVREGFVTVVPWGLPVLAGLNVQTLAYAHAICVFGPAWRWMAFIDLDEFLFPVDGDSLAELLRGYDDLPALLVPWTMFGFSGHTAPAVGLVTENYTMRAPFPVGANIKTIVNPAEVEVVSVHRMTLLGLGRAGYDENRKLHRKGDPMPSTHIFRLNHYYTRSRQEFEAKIALKATNLQRTFEARHLEFARRIASEIETCPVYDDAILRFVPGLKRRLTSAGAESSLPRVLLD